ncbi:MAG: hypothetical protein PF551_00425 [Candidatus Marinimicrobia bacterium]|jgi:hypothetical protein|nr:hypothetical protein [Candidatus Neomarinimicrobiota bacterium]
MYENENDQLKEELKEFKEEKEKIRKLVGEIGGKNTVKRDKTISAIFIVAIILLFIVDILRHLLHIDIPLPPLFSIEIGILLVSMKIIWMIHQQSKVNHFEFWILNSIEYRLNDISNRLAKFLNKK